MTWSGSIRKEEDINVLQSGRGRAAVTQGPDSMFAPELVRCIGAGRDPTVDELFTVASRVWADGAASRSAFVWGQLPPEHPEKVEALRAAQIALCGDIAIPRR